MQGYVVEYSPREKIVTISQRGQILKQYKMSTPSRRAYDQTVGKFISAQEDDKYPTDIEDRDVALPMKRVAENKSSKAYEQGGRAGYYGRAYKNPYESGTNDHADYKRGYLDFRNEGKDYGVEKKKQSPSIDRDRDFLEGEDQSQPNNEVMKRLFKDFGDIFGKQPPQPKSQEPKQKEVKEMNRAGYNPLTSEKHWHEVERQLAQLINDRTLDPESRAEARQRYLEKRKEAQQKGWAK
jgi:hypothetical protein